MKNDINISSKFTGEAALPSYEFINKVEKSGEKVLIKFDGMTIKIPEDDFVLIDNANVEINEGDRVAFTGPNGSGKSSLFRVMRGLNWEGSGSVLIEKPDDKHIFCSPQELRKATITLPGILAYKNPPEDYSHKEYENVLKAVGMDRLISHLPWNAVSPENILRHAQEHIDNYLYPYKGKISASSAKSFIDRFRKVLDDKLDMPPPLQNVYNDDIHNEVIEHITAYVQKELENDQETQDSQVLFTKRAAKKTAEAIAENTRDSLDSWLLQGHRMKLSGGEQQKLVFARILLQKPDILLLDEVTSALKGETAHELYKMMLDELPNCTIISIIHNDSLLLHHTHHLELDTDKHMTMTPIDNAYLQEKHAEIKQQRQQTRDKLFPS